MISNHVPSHVQICEGVEPLVDAPITPAIVQLPNHLDGCIVEVSDIHC